MVLLKSTGTNSSLDQAIQKAVEENADIVVHSEWGSTTACDSLADGAEAAVYDAHTAGTLTVLIAGNGGNGGSCNLRGPSEIMSAFVVGGVGNDSDDCNANAGLYAGCDIYSSSSRGGMNITVSGVVRAGQVSQVSAVAPACPHNSYTETGFDPSTTLCGTSYAAPQVAGAAALFADWHISDFGAPLLAGTLSSWMQMMTDRATSATGKATVGMDDVWGAGRFQMRYFGDHPSGSGANETGAWGWEATRYVVDNNTADILEPMLDSAAEPSTLQQYKAHLTFFEENNTNAADIVLDIWKANCTGPGTNRIDGDASFDVRKMARASAAQAAGQALCTAVPVLSVPGTQMRTVILKQYYSTSTTFR